VGAKVGFTNPAAFATAFRRATGEAPRSFRAKRRPTRTAVAPR
jgi:AraC-like DNA-binding protein